MSGSQPAQSGGGEPLLQSAAPTKARGWLRALRWAWMLTLLGVIAAAFVTQRDALAEFQWSFSPGFLALAILVAMVRKAWGALLWSHLLAALSGEHIFSNLVRNTRTYFLTNLASYLPGSLWYIPWRIARNRAAGVSALHTSLASLLESLILVIAHAMVGLPALIALIGSQVEVNLVPLLLAIVAAASIVHPASLRVLLRLAARLLGRQIDVPRLSWRQTFVALLLATAACFTAGVSLWLLLRSFTAESAIELLPTLTFAFALAWLVGFLTPIAPAGLGVREGILILLLAPHLPIEVVTLLGIAARALFFAEDLLWGGLTVLSAALFKKRDRS